MNTIILAAGKGTRMKSKLPKVLHKVAGKFMLQHVIDAAKSAGSNREVVIIGNGAELVREKISGVEFALQAEQLGTGHAVLCAKDFFTNTAGTLLILCGDTPLFTGELLKNFVDAHENSKSAATVLTAIMPNATGYGRIVRDDKNNFSKIVEHKDCTADELKISEVNAGVYCFDTQKLFAALDKVTNDNAQGEYYLPDALSILKNDGEKISAVVAEDYKQTLGINSRVQLAEAEKILRMRKNISLMESGVTIIDPATTYIDFDVEIGQDTIIYPGTFIEGETEIGSDCVIGPFVHIRPNTKINDGVKIGNFVEVKNSVIGEGTKLPHLQYIGDTDMGAGCNVGCGTVTCNYDGKKKFRTTVGDKVFIGCNTNLVAPVTVESNSYIAAGSTITENIPENNLAVARSRQKNISGWADKRNQ